MPFQHFGAAFLEPQGESLPQLPFPLARLQISLPSSRIRVTQTGLVRDKPQRAPVTPGSNSPLERVSNPSLQITCGAGLPTTLLHAQQNAGDDHGIMGPRSWIGSSCKSFVVHGGSFRNSKFETHPDRDFRFSDLSGCLQEGPEGFVHKGNR